jgi:hypothetical protein
MEADWKKIRSLVPTWRERYIARKNLAVRSKINDSSKTETERFWDVYEFTEKEGKVLRTCLDGHSRSKMLEFLWVMLGYKMITKEDLNDFSPELQKSVLPENNDQKS